ncbi:hypothetical protein A9K65_013545 [Mesorhizobium sp. WSM1497]|nr:hypothetical protein A9K65_013545 [Mesorhizobium sp. WSM1497]
MIIQTSTVSARMPEPKGEIGARWRSLQSPLDAANHQYADGDRAWQTRALIGSVAEQWSRASNLKRAVSVFIAAALQFMIPSLRYVGSSLA